LGKLGKHGEHPQDRRNVEKQQRMRNLMGLEKKEWVPRKKEVKALSKS